MAQEKTSYEKVAEIIATSKKEKWENEESFNDKEGISLRRIVESNRLGAEIFWGKKWVLHGVIVKASNGRITSSTTYQYGIKYGAFISFHENGEIKRQTNFKKGLEDGSQFNYRKDGTLESYEEYQGGDRNGASISYYPNGKTKHYEYQYKDNDPVTRLAFNEKGEKMEKCTFDKNRNIINRQKFK